MANWGTFYTISGLQKEIKKPKRKGESDYWVQNLSLVWLLLYFYITFFETTFAYSEVLNDTETGAPVENVKTTEEDLPPKYEDVAETPPDYEEATRKSDL